MTAAELLDRIEQAMTSPWGIKEEISGPDFSAQLEFSPYNRRILILDYHFSSLKGPANLVSLLEGICIRRNLEKIWGKMRRTDLSLFVSRGFQEEAYIKDFFSTGDDAVICSKFFGKRGDSSSRNTNQQILERVKSCGTTQPAGIKLPRGYRFKLAAQKDLPDLAALYRQVFPTYPYPVYEAAYLEKCMQHTLYGLVYLDDCLAAAASAEINFKFGNAEMTDFASLPVHRGQGLAPFILAELEKVISAQGIRCFYTLARSTSPGMNLTFARASYQYAGTLVNNCNISGGFEDMNVFYKTR